MAVTGDVSDLDTLMFGGEPMLPERGSYSVKLQGGVVSSDFDAGLDKQDIQFLNSPYQVSCTYFALDGFKAAYVESFFNRQRGQKFIANLLIGTNDIEEFVVQLIGTPKMSQTGNNGEISVTYKVEPAIDRCWNDTLFYWGGCVDDPMSVWCYTKEGIELWP